MHKKKIRPKGGRASFYPKSANNFQILLEYKLAGEVRRDQVTNHKSKGFTLDLKPRADIS